VTLANADSPAMDDQ